ncbi:hypothetical protein H4R35_000080 [Dimargaris xerosporica]|nr:hypothetical protein H4R35_000080 [Dimargaris xerosporica]
MGTEEPGTDCRASEHFPTPRLQFARRLWRRLARPNKAPTTTVPQPSNPADAEATTEPPASTWLSLPASASHDSGPTDPAAQSRSANDQLWAELQELDRAKSRDALLLETLKLRLEIRGLESKLQLAELEHRADAVRLKIANGQIQTLNNRIEFYKEMKQTLEANSVLSKLRVEQYDLEATQLVQYIEELTASQGRCLGLVHRLLQAMVLTNAERSTTQGHLVAGSGRNRRPPGLRPRDWRQRLPMYP